MCGLNASISTHGEYECTMLMARGVELHYTIVGRAFSALLKCMVGDCSSWLGLGFTPSPRRMLGATAVVKLPGAGDSIKMFSLQAKAPSGVVEVSAETLASWRLRNTRVEMFNGRHGLHLTLDLPESISLSALHLIFAGGTGNAFTYHGVERGGMTLNLYGKHYSLERISPPPPPTTLPYPPPPPSCIAMDEDDGSDNPDLYPCEAQLSSGVRLNYGLQGDELRASLSCSGCEGWMALAFDEQPSTLQHRLVEAQTVVGSFASVAAPATWTLDNLQVSGDTYLKSSGGTTYSTGIAVTDVNNIVEIELTGKSQRRDYYRICLTTEPNDGADCTGGAMLGLFPKGKFFTGCFGEDKRIILGYKPGQRVSIRYDMAEQQLLMRKDGELLRLCSTKALPRPDFYGKLMIYNQGYRIGGLKVVSAAAAATMVSRHTMTDGLCDAVSGVCSAATAPALPEGQQTLRQTSLEHGGAGEGGGATMAFIARRVELMGASSGTFRLTFLAGRSPAFSFQEAANRSSTVLRIDPPVRIAPPSITRPPPPPSCSDSSLAASAGFPCSARLDSRVELFYSLTEEEREVDPSSGTANGVRRQRRLQSSGSRERVPVLKARVACASCTGWIAMGFPATPGTMVGATAIIGEPASASVKAYSLGARTASAVVPLPASEQQLRGVLISSADGGVSMEFTVTLGEAGVPADLAAADILHASGGSPAVSYHGGTRGGTVVRFQMRTPDALSAMDMGTLGQALGQSRGGDAAAGGLGSGALVLIACIVSFVIGAAVVIGVMKVMRRDRGYHKPGASEEKYATAIEAAVSAVSSSVVRAAPDRAAPTPPAEYPPLPKGWEEHLDEGTRRMFYANGETGEVVWVRPYK